MTTEGKIKPEFANIDPKDLAGVFPGNPDDYICIEGAGANHVLVPSLLTVSEYAAKFPSVSGVERDDMEKGIAKSGVREPIIVRQVIDKHWEIIDGRNRFEIAKQRGKLNSIIYVDIRAKLYSEGILKNPTDTPTETQIKEFVWDRNAARRSLADVALRLVIYHALFPGRLTAIVKEKDELKKEGQKQGGRGKKKLTVGATASLQPLTAGEAIAKAAGVGNSTGATVAAEIRDRGEEAVISDLASGVTPAELQRERAGRKASVSPPKPTKVESNTSSAEAKGDGGWPDEWDRKMATDPVFREETNAKALRYFKERLVAMEKAGDALRVEFDEICELEAYRADGYLTLEDFLLGITGDILNAARSCEWLLKELPDQKKPSGEPLDEMKSLNRYLRIHREPSHDERLAKDWLRRAVKLAKGADIDEAARAIFLAGKKCYPKLLSLECVRDALEGAAHQANTRHEAEA